MTPLPRVQPGDLITAEFMNSILDRLDALEARLGQPQPTLTLPTHTFPTFTATLFTPTFTIPTFVPTETFVTIPPLTIPQVTLPQATSILNVNPLFNQLAAIKPESPIATLPGIGKSETVALNSLGITNVKGLAAADPVLVAHALSVKPEEANALISVAKGSLG